SRPRRGIPRAARESHPSRVPPPFHRCRPRGPREFLRGQQEQGARRRCRRRFFVRAWRGRGADLPEFLDLEIPLGYSLKSFRVNTIVPEVPVGPSGGIALRFNSSNTAEESPAVPSN